MRAAGFEKCKVYDVNFTELLGGAPQLDPLPPANSSWAAVPCAFGWNYDNRDYDVTLVTKILEKLFSYLGGAVEIPSYIITWYAMDRWGRRWVLCLTMLLGGIACVSCMFVPEHPVWVTVSLAMIGKFGIAASFAVFYVFVGELLPTVIRSQAMGIASFIAGIGLLGFPYIVYLAVYNRVLPLIIMGTLSVAGAIASIFLPETLNIHLPQTLEEGEAFGVDFKLLSCPTRQRSRQHSAVDYIPAHKMANGMIDTAESESSESHQDLPNPRFV
ncbi:Carcinine transporter [Gryllus bimaculatus]|nr:Carcinine transporter [Gryllus bimaculatus]